MALIKSPAPTISIATAAIRPTSKPVVGKLPVPAAASAGVAVAFGSAVGTGASTTTLLSPWA